MLAVMVVFAMAPSAFAAEIPDAAEPGMAVLDDTFASGEGTAESPYIINTADQLAAFAQEVDAGTTYEGQYVALGADIDLSAVENWNPIGAEGLNAEAIFNGTFDGAGYVINGMNITGTYEEEASVGLFSTLNTAAVVQNLKMTNVSVNVIGKSKIRAGSVSGDVKSGGGSMNNVSAEGSVTALSDAASMTMAGGLSGRTNKDFKLVNAWTDVTVSASVTGGYAAAYAGGITGNTGNNTLFANVAALGSVTANSEQGNANAGGIAGMLTGALVNVYAIGTVQSNTEDYAGMIAGSRGFGKAEYVYYSTDSGMAADGSGSFGDRIEAAGTYASEEMMEENFAAILNGNIKSAYAVISEEGFSNITLNSWILSSKVVPEGEAVQDGVYALVNIPYSVFYTAEGINFMDDVDAVSSATNKTGNYGKAGGVYHSGTSANVVENEDGTVTVTATGGDTDSKPQGVIWAVKADSVDAVKALGGTEITDESDVYIATVGRGQASYSHLYGYEALVEAPDYSYYVLSEAPDYYMVLDSEGSFSKTVGSAQTEDALEDLGVSYGTNWGDVQLAPAVDATNNTLINAVAITAKDADGNETTAGLYALDQIWANNSLGWRVAVTEGLDGKTITNIRYYCTVKDTDLTDTEAPAYANYIIDYPANQEISQVYTGTITAGVDENGDFTVSGLPEDAQNVKAKIYHTTGGRNATITYITPLVVDPADDDIDPDTADVVDGKIEVSKELVTVTNSKGESKTYGQPIAGTTYTVELSCDNYILSKTTVVYAMPDLYIQMNVPFDDFYEAYDLTDYAVWEVEEGVDAVSTATESKFKGTTGLARGTYNNGTYIMGVTLPVKVSADDIAKLGVTLTENDDYYYSVLETEPEYYAELTIGDEGDYSFSQIQDSTYSADNLTVDELDTTAGYGDYQVSLTNVNTDVSKGIVISDDIVLTNYSVYGAILNIDDGSYGMTCLENLWFGTKRDVVEIAWSIPEGQQLQRGHGHGGLFYQFEGINGGELKSVDLITNYGIFHLTEGDAIGTLTEYFAGDLSSLEYSIDNGSTELLISGIPDELENVKISLSAGREFLAEKAEITDGKVALSNAPSAGTTYTLAISSDNYPDITRTLATPVTPGEKEALQTWINKAKAAEGYEEDTDLKEHVAEAEEMLESETATSADAEELIEELKEKTKKHYPQAKAAMTITPSAAFITLDGAELADLENPSYAITYKAGRGSSTLQSGDLTSLYITFENAATVGTEYTITITSDNYQNITAAATAEQLSIENAIIADIEDQAYTGSAVTPEIHVRYEGGNLQQDKHYTVAYKDNTEIGTATVTITGIGDFTGEVTKTFNIVKADSSATAPSANKLTFNNKAQALVKAGTAAGGTMQYSLDNKTFGTALPTAAKAGTYTVYYKVVGDENHNDSAVQSVKVTIAKAANTLNAKAKSKTVSAKSKKKTTIKANKAFKVTKAQGKVAYKKTSGNKKITVTSNGKITVKKGLKKGTYTVKVKVTAAGNANYNKATKTVTIKVKVK